MKSYIYINFCIDKLANNALQIIVESYKILLVEF